MEKLNFEQTIKAHMKRAGLDPFEVARELSHTPAQFSRWIQYVSQLSKTMIELSSLLGLTEEERSELFSLVADGAITSSHRPTGQIQSEQRDCGGRPRDEDNDWAFEQVYLLHRPRCDVYQEWLARRKEHRNFGQLADPYDSFKKALNTRRKKGKKGD